MNLSLVIWWSGKPRSAKYLSTLWESPSNLNNESFTPYQPAIPPAVKPIPPIITSRLDRKEWRPEVSTSLTHEV